MKILVSVIMSVYKEPVENVAKSVSSIIAQTYTNWEFIIVLDHPNNLIVRDYLVNLSKNHDNIKLIVNKSNIGLGASLNKAVALAKGKYCARMDAEDRSFIDRFEVQLSYLNHNSHVDLLFTQWKELYPDGSTKEVKPASSDVKNIQKNFFIKSILLHPTLMVRTAILKDHSYPEIARPEDWVLFLKLIRLGYNFDVVEKITYEYVVDEKLKYQKVRKYSRNLLPHLAKNVRYYWSNIYFWLYFMRILFEFIISRNHFIYTKTSTLAAIFWKKVF